MSRHPAAVEPELLRFCIPLRAHGDDASIKSLHNRKLCIVSVHAEFGSGSPLDSRLLNFVIPDERLIPGKTLPFLMAAWVWSWHLCLAGKHPTTDHLGNPFSEGTKRFQRRGHRLAGPYTFAWAGSLGDWSWQAKFFYPYLHGASHNFICSRCLASRTLRRFRFDDHTRGAGLRLIIQTQCMTHHGPSTGSPDNPRFQSNTTCIALGLVTHTGWRQTYISTESFLSSLPADASAVFFLPGFDLQLVRTDFMHAGFLGLFQAMAGSIIWELLNLAAFAPTGTSMKLNLDSAFGAWSAYLRVNKFRIDASRLSLSMLSNPQSGNWPDLNGKAHDCRMCIGWLAVETQRSPDFDTPYGRMRAALAWTAQANFTCSFAIDPRKVIAWPTVESGATICRTHRFGDCSRGILASSRLLLPCETMSSVRVCLAWLDVPRHFVVLLRSTPDT